MSSVAKVKPKTPEPPPPLVLDTTTQFDRDLKRQEKRGKALDKLHDIIEILHSPATRSEAERPLPGWGLERLARLPCRARLGLDLPEGRRDITTRPYRFTPTFLSGSIRSVAGPVFDREVGSDLRPIKSRKIDEPASAIVPTYPSGRSTTRRAPESWPRRCTVTGRNRPTVSDLPSLRTTYDSLNPGWTHSWLPSAQVSRFQIGAPASECRSASGTLQTLRCGAGSSRRRPR